MRKALATLFKRKHNPTKGLDDALKSAPSYLRTELLDMRANAR